MLKQDPYPGRQLRSLIAAALLSPVTRQIPGSAAALGGRAAWAAPLAALPALLFYAWLLSRLGGLNAVWWAFPIAEAVSLCICLLLYRKINNDLLKKL